VVNERLALRDGVIADIHRSAVGPQKLVGPFLVIPFRKTYVETSTSSEGKTTTATRVEAGQLRFVPDELVIDASVTTERRYRGIYAALLYNSHQTIEGAFALPENFGVVEG